MQKYTEAFKAADAAKNRGNYATSNFIFGWLLQQHATTTVNNLMVGVEYSPLNEDGEGEGNPCDQRSVDNEWVSEYQYHCLITIKDGLGGYLCIPAPMLSTEALRYCFKHAKRESGFVPLLDHKREVNVQPTKEGEYDLSNIHKLLGAFEVPKWIFHDMEFEMIPFTPQKGNRQSLNRIR